METASLSEYLTLSGPLTPHRGADISTEERDNEAFIRLVAGRSQVDEPAFYEGREFFAARDLLQYRSFGYGHSFGVLSHYYGREAGLELREDIDTALTEGMVVSFAKCCRPVPGDAIGLATAVRRYPAAAAGDSGSRAKVRKPTRPPKNDSSLVAPSILTGASCG